MAQVTAPHHPLSTYRLQLQPEFTFHDAADAVPYLADLGVSHLYLSPILEPVPGSTHGYDVVDHSQLAEQLGGREGFLALSNAARDAGLGIIVDVVPNHMAAPTPAHMNPALWSVLKDGPKSPYAEWIDVNWDDSDNPLLMPVLGTRIGTVLTNDELQVVTVDGEPCLKYYDHVFPLRPGTEGLPMAELLGAQWYRLAYWKIADEELNYRRFFDVDTLMAVRVENPDVFLATHDVILQLMREGHIDGLRIDHPDGLADPQGYLKMLAEHTDGAWVVVEKILEGDENLPSRWATHGTTGYDALWRIGGLFEDPASTPAAFTLWQHFTDNTASFEEVATAAKHLVVEDLLHSEVARLTELAVKICSVDIRLRDHSRRSIESAIVELLVAFDRYRAYSRPGEPLPAESVAAMDAATAIAKERLDEEYHDTLEIISSLALGQEVGSAGHRGSSRRAEFCIRFQQTCGPVMAKGIEDTTFYQWFPLPWRCEVGANATAGSFSPDAFHAFAQQTLRSNPLTLTTLSTHDTKRSEDTRAVMRTPHEDPHRWAQHINEWSRRAEPLRGPLVDKETEYLFWHTIFALTQSTTPDPDRIWAYLQKAVREGKKHTTWVDQDADYEGQIEEFSRAVLTDQTLTDIIVAARGEYDDAVRSNVLSQKAVQLMMPGIPDVYQGTEEVTCTLVDPDNRSLVDYPHLAKQLDATRGTKASSLNAEKQLLTAAALQTRTESPEVFFGDDAQYSPVAVTTAHAVAFARHTDDNAGVITIATRLPITLRNRGGMSGHSVVLPEGTWTNLLTGEKHAGGSADLGAVLGSWPVALLRHSASSN